MLKKFVIIAAIVLTTLTNLNAETKTKKADIVVYGGASSGVMAAVQASRMGKSVILVVPSKRLGGLSAGGLGQTDVGKTQVLAGLNAEFYGRIYKYYDDPANWFCETRDQWRKKKSWGHKIYKNMMFKFEPHVAEKLFNDFVKEEQKNITVLLGERLDRGLKAKKDRTAIKAIVMESGLNLVGKVYIDCTYEGDLMAAAGVSYTVGRESNDKYGEKANGIQTGSRHHQMPKGFSPHFSPGI